MLFTLSVFVKYNNRLSNLRMVMIKFVAPTPHSRLQSYIGLNRTKNFCLTMVKLLTLVGLMLTLYTFTAWCDPIDVKRWREARDRTSTDANLVSGKNLEHFATVCVRVCPFSNRVCVCALPKSHHLFCLWPWLRKKVP